MLNPQTKIYDGESLSGATAGVAYIPIVEDGMCKKLLVKTDEAVSGAPAVFSCTINGANVPDLAATIPIGQKQVIAGPLAVALAVGDEVVFHLASGDVASPISFSLFVDDGIKIPTTFDFFKGDVSADTVYKRNDIVRQGAELYVNIQLVDEIGVSYSGSVPDLNGETDEWKVVLSEAMIQLVGDARYAALAATTAALAAKADLVGGKVPAAQLPAYVDDVLEFADLAAFPAVGETGKIYVAIDTNKEYRWSGSTYIHLVSSPGTTDEVPEGAANKYFTAARVWATVLTGIVFTTNSAITAADSILVAFGKLQAQITAILAMFANYLPTSYLDTDGTAAANSDTKIMSQKAVRTYVGANAGSGGTSLPSQTGQTGKYLKTDGVNLSWGTPDGAANGWTRKTAVASVNRMNTTVLTADPVLQFPIVSGKSYAVKIAAVCNSPASEGFRFDIDCPASGGFVGNYKSSSSAGLVQSNIAKNAPVNLGAGFIHYLEISCNVVFASANGTFSLRWSQLTSGATPATIHPLSVLEYLET